jgi:glycosyltransferase involved in cell wall biosynthesis
MIVPDILFGEAMSYTRFTTEEGASLGKRGPATPGTSVVIPAYNVTRYIRDALDSVFSQTIRPFEVIVVNDGSTDSEELDRIMAAYEEPITYIAQTNTGSSSARNAGIRAAKGEYVAFLDADDVWESNYLEVQSAYAVANPQADVIYCNAVYFGDTLDAGQFFMDLCPSSGEVTFESLVSRRTNVFTSVLARKSALFEVGMFDEELRCSEDYDLWLRLAAAGKKFFYHRESLVRYRRRKGSLSADPIWLTEKNLLVLEKARSMKVLSESEKKALEKRIRFQRSALSFWRGKRAFFNRDFRSAVGLFNQANRERRSWKLRIVTLLVRFLPGLLLQAYRVRDKFVFGHDTSTT